LGNDSLSGDIGDDTLNGDDGNDKIVGGNGFDYLEGGIGNDVLSGGADDDTLIGGSGNDSVDGGAGNDLIIAGQDGSGNDNYNGGAGNDTLDYTAVSDGIKIDLSRGLVGLLSGDATIIGTDRVTGFEIVQSGSGSDTIIGNAGFNLLYGNDGDDVLIGGGGKDELYGGGGSDVFTYKSVAESGLIVTKRDVLSDFEGSDKIDLSAIDAMSGGTANDAFTFIGGSSNLTTANANGALWFESGILYGSTDFDVAAEFSISLPTMGSMEQNYFTF
jgi:Ca2+-binding RTX toxin-like protein